MNSACMLTFGYFSMNTSESAFASFSMEVEPAIVIEPLKSAGAASSEASSLLASAVVSAAAASVSAAAAVVAAVVSFALPEQPARPVSYTHLDVYKRQPMERMIPVRIPGAALGRRIVRIMYHFVAPIPSCLLYTSRCV